MTVPDQVLASWVTEHELLQVDRQPAAEMHQQFLLFKGQLRGITLREMFAEAMEHVPLPPVSFKEDRIGGIPGWWCVPEGANKNRALLYLHGGAYVLGSAKSFRNLAGHLAHRAGVRTFLPEYRLAPEHPFPAAVHDAEAACKGLAERGYTGIALAGDSAGGGLALSLLRSLTLHSDRLAARPSALVAFSPWTDLALTGSTFQSRAEADPLFVHDQLQQFASLYLGSVAPNHAPASPLYGEFHELPPIQIHVGDHEVLLDDSLRYAEAAAAAGVEVQVNIWRGMHHVFVSAVGRLQAAEEALTQAGLFLRSWFQTGQMISAER